MKQRSKPSVLIIDDSKNFARRFAHQLESIGYIVETVDSSKNALKFLGEQSNPTFIVADRMLQGNLIENGDLNTLAKAAGSSHIVVYTQKADLSEAEIRYIQSQGAKRVLDRSEMSKLVKDIGRLTKEFDDLLELAHELTNFMKEREKLVTALVGADVGVTVIDNEFQCWFANAAQERFVGGHASGGLCWQRFHGHPASAGPCWGCTVARVMKTREKVDRLFLSRFRNGFTGWVSVRSTPILGGNGVYGESGSGEPRVIAVREGVVEAGTATIDSLSLQNRLEYIAQALIHVGFGRARIWAMRVDGKAVVRAAASVTDDPWAERSQYQEGLGGLAVNPDDCPYNRKVRSKGGLFVEEWSDGKCPWLEGLELELPYFLLPVWKTHEDVWGFLATDFVGVSEIARKAVLSHYAKEETLLWLRDEYVREIREAFEFAEVSVPGTQHEAIVEMAQLGIGAARSLSEGVFAVREALDTLLPDDCAVSLRRVTKNQLEEYSDLSWGPGTPSTKRVIQVDDRKSLASYVFRIQRARWIDDFPKHREKAQRIGQPAGYPSVGTKSSAHIPLRVEGSMMGTISIDSPKDLRWFEDGYARPLLQLADLIALVVRDLWVNEQLAQRQASLKADLNAMIAFAETVGSDAIWRHWATQRLAQVSALAEQAHLLIENRPRASKALTDLLFKISDVINIVAEGGPPSEDAEESCSLSEVLFKLKESYQDKSSNLILTFPKKSPRIAAAFFHVRHILDILLSNAFEAIEESGDGSEVCITTTVVDEMVRIEVTDDGPGIPAGIAKGLLRTAVSSSAKGHGVGLLIARGTALRFNGDLEAHPTQKGASFLLTLPLADH